MDVEINAWFIFPSLYVQLYVEVLKENGALREKLQETQLQLSECKVELERLRQVCVRERLQPCFWNDFQAEALLIQL